jgi:RNA polymerase sigma-70 factor, ECF subfamily
LGWHGFIKRDSFKRYCQTRAYYRGVMQEDSVIIQRVLNGETEAFRLLVERYQGPLFGLLSGLLPVAECEDIAQETFLTAFDKLTEYEAERSRFSTWLLTIGRNKALNFVRKHRPLVMERPPEMPDPLTPEVQLDEREWFRHLDAALAFLPADQRSAFVLADMQGLSYEEISQLEEVQMGTVKSRLSRARQKLRALLGGG